MKSRERLLVALARHELRTAAAAALPICLGYIALGLPCGLLGIKAGMSLLQVIVLSLIFYSGSGQFMIASLTIAGVPALSTALTVSLVNARQLLYASALLPHFKGLTRIKALLCAFNVTDESFGVNIARLQAGTWQPRQIMLVNILPQLTWVLANTVGALVGSLLDIPTAIAAFAMTSIFLCLLLMQKGRADYLLAATGSVAGVVACKFVGLDNVAIFVGAVLGVGVGMLARIPLKKRIARAEADFGEKTDAVA
ncbi:MAG: AzlC family ABC transporter permease [Coriobacteriales bacterium]|nr:AzlC family ABC transporter permease [Coriobacteriales bacterium]